MGLGVQIHFTSVVRQRDGQIRVIAIKAAGGWRIARLARRRTRDVARVVAAPDVDIATHLVVHVVVGKAGAGDRDVGLERLARCR